MELNEATDSVLNSEQIKVVNALRSATPVVALPDSGMGRRPKTFNDVLVSYEKVLNYLKYEMNKSEELRDQLREVEGEIRGAGKLLARMGVGGPSARDVLKAVHSAVLIRHEFTAEDVKEIAEKNGVKL